MPTTRKRRLQAEIQETALVTEGTNLITVRLDTETAAQCRPGHFFNLQAIDSTSPLLRRPISICDVRPDTCEMDLLVQVVGEGTRLLTERRPGGLLDLVGPLGNPFHVFPEQPALMIAGGVGVAPVHYLAQYIRRQGGESTRIVFCYGARAADYFVLLDRLEEIGVELVLTTEDGSKGRRGYVTSVVPEFLDPEMQTFICGPSPMMNAALALLKERDLEGQISLENQMGCGVGACLGCVVPGTEGNIRVCCDGPVVSTNQIDFVMKD